jgi:hypothetical protein
MHEFDFRTAALDGIVDSYLRNGCALLRNFVESDALAAAYDLMRSTYPEVEAFHIHPHHLHDRGRPMFSDLLFTQRSHELLAHVFGDHEVSISRQTASRRLNYTLVREPPNWLRPLAPHIDAFFHPAEFTVNVWVPFQACGHDAPSLGVVAAPFSEVLDFVGFDPDAEGWGEGPPRWNYPRFRQQMVAMHDRRDPLMTAEMRDRFAGRVWQPSFEPGDAMMLSNWTLHFTHFTPAMSKRRESLELRFESNASLDEILSEHAIAL